jgi:molybdopterin-binding protein
LQKLIVGLYTLLFLSFGGMAQDSITPSAATTVPTTKILAIGHIVGTLTAEQRRSIEIIHVGEVMAHIVVKVGENLVESVITRTSAEELRLKKGDAVRVIVKSTEVMIQKD